MTTKCFLLVNAEDPYKTDHLVECVADPGDFSQESREHLERVALRCSGRNSRYYEDPDHDWSETIFRGYNDPKGFHKSNRMLFSDLYTCARPLSNKEGERFEFVDYIVPILSTKAFVDRSKEVAFRFLLQQVSRAHSTRKFVSMTCTALENAWHVPEFDEAQEGTLREMYWESMKKVFSWDVASQVNAMLENEECFRSVERSVYFTKNRHRGEGVKHRTRDLVVTVEDDRRRVRNHARKDKRKRRDEIVRAVAGKRRRRH